jgi:hypothetical protein
MNLIECNDNLIKKYIKYLIIKDLLIINYNILFYKNILFY